MLQKHILRIIIEETEYMSELSFFEFALIVSHHVERVYLNSVVARTY